MQLADAFVAVMQHNNIAVYVHPGQEACGMNRLAVGDVDRARSVAAKNVRLLAEAVRQGYEIVCTEPTAALCLKREYLDRTRDSGGNRGLSGITATASHCRVALSIANPHKASTS